MAGIAALLSGKKTYIVGALMVIQGIYGYFTGQSPTFDNPTPMNPVDSVMMVLEGLGLSTVRAGISKVGR